MNFVYFGISIIIFTFYGATNYYIAKQVLMWICLMMPNITKRIY